MEFEYFLNTSALSGIPVREAQYYNVASSWGDFTPGTGLQTISDSSNDETFTCFLTFDKLQTGSQILISNFESTAGLNSGFVFGIDSNNHFFIDSKTNGECYTFSDVTLGRKNCVVFQRNYSNFSVYKYDLVSRAIEYSESYQFSPESSLYGSNVSVGGSNSLSGYNLGRYTGTESVNLFNGTIDQFVYLSGSVEKSYLVDLLSGFLPIGKVETTQSLVSLDNESYRFPDGLYADNNAFLTNYLTGTSYKLATGLVGAGEWYGTGYGAISTEGMTGTLSYYTGINHCYGTGSAISDYYTGIGVDSYPSLLLEDGSYLLNVFGGHFYLDSGDVSSLETISTTFTDTVRVSKGPNFTVISHNLVFSQSGNNYHVDYDVSYLNDSSNSYSWLETGSYYTGFKMEGIVSDQVSSLALAAGTDIAPTGYNLPGFYDNSENRFYIPYFLPGAAYLNGAKYTSGYTVDGYYVDFANVTESSNDYVIGDNHSGSTLLGTGSTFATGSYYSSSSQAFSGVYPSGRMKRSDYKETCGLHLYHASQVQGLGSTFLFEI